MRMRQISELFCSHIRRNKFEERERESSMNDAVEWNIHNKYAQHKIKHHHHHHHHHLPSSFCQLFRL